MKICYISYVKFGAGRWVHTSQFIAALQGMHDNLIVHTPLANQARSAIKDKLSVQQTRSNIRELRLLVGMFGRRSWKEFRLLRAERPDVVILRRERYLSAVLLCKILRIPIILEVNAPFLEDQFSPKEQQLRGKIFWQWLEKRILSLPSHIMLVSEELKRYYTSSGISPRKMTCVPNGVEIDSFTPSVNGDRVRDKFGLKDKVVIGFSGNFAPWHGLDFLADTMRTIYESGKFDNIAFFLVGRPGTQIVMPELPDEITVVTGRVNYAEMPEYLAAIDIFVAPYPPIEPFYFSPLKIFEAMSMGTPVIASAQGQICELITDQHNGILYPPGDRDALRNGIERLIIEKEQRAKFGANARKTIEENFTWKDNAQRMLELCRQVVC
ncbi:Glycosyltransferase involved in cell wall bisynthesis [Candidatus Electrothrix gigas]